MSTNHHTPIPSSPPQPATAATINAPLAELDAAIDNATHDVDLVSVQTATEWGTASTPAINLSNTGSAGTPTNPHGLGELAWWSNGVRVAAIEAIKQSPVTDERTSIIMQVHNGSSFRGVVEIDKDGGIYILDNCSALSFTDRTRGVPEGTDALAAIATIANDENGDIDHSTLPEFVRVRRGKVKHAAPTDGDEPIAMRSELPAEPEHEDERDLGAMISLLTVAVQQLTKRLEAIEARHIDDGR
jgi:hypothetical protein